MALNKENKENEINIKNKEITIENKENTNINEVINAFKYFDRKKNGKIELSDLKYTLTHLGNKMTEEEFDKIFKKANVDINQNIDLDYMKIINFFNNNK